MLEKANETRPSTRFEHAPQRAQQPDPQRAQQVGDAAIRSVNQNVTRQVGDAAIRGANQE